ncbi:MAG TPA: CerR family C-terminal domain-containing protein [Bryobacteraceae bacterium]|jgi:AcrR family transcriptional regulator
MPGRTTRARCQKAPADGTRTKLLAAAVAVFAERGFDGATTREICSRAGANVALVNYHFGDKLELYREVIRYAIDAAAKMEMLNAALEQNADPSDAFRQLVHGVIERLSETRNDFGLHLRLVLKEMTQPTVAFSDVLDETLRPLYDRLRALIGRILNLPIDHETTRLCTHSVMGQVSHYAVAQPVLAYLWPEMKMTPEQRQRVAEHIADFSLAYLRSYRAKTAEQRHSRIPRRSR